MDFANRNIFMKNTL